MQTDPIGYEGGINLYAYVGNDPVNATDPSGKFCPWCLGVAAGGLAAGVSSYLSGNSWTGVAASAIVGVGLGATFNAAGLGELMAYNAARAGTRAAIAGVVEVVQGATTSGGVTLEGQTFAIAVGEREDYDWTAVGTSTLTGRVGGTMPGAFSASTAAARIEANALAKNSMFLSGQANAMMIDASFALLSQPPSQSSTTINVNACLQGRLCPR